RLAAEPPADLAEHVLHRLAPALLDRLARLAEPLEVARSSTLDQIADPSPGQPKASVGEPPLDLELADDAPVRGKDLHGLRGRALERDLSGPGRERDVAQLDVDRAALLTGRGQPIGDPGRLSQQPVLDLGPGREVVMKRVLVADLLALASGRDLAIVEPEAQSMQVSTVLAELALERRLAEPGDVADRAHAVATQQRLRLRAHAPQLADRQGIQERLLGPGRDLGQPVGLVLIAGDLGDELAAREPDRAG